MSEKKSLPGNLTMLNALRKAYPQAEFIEKSKTLILDETDIYDPGVDVVPLRAQVGMVFQKPNPFPKTIYENIAYGMKVNGIKDKDYID